MISYYQFTENLPNTSNWLSQRKKKTEDRKQIPSLDEKRIHREKIYNFRQELERFKKDTKRKNDIDIGRLIKEETITRTECNTKEEKIKQNFLLALAPAATRQIPQSDYQTEPDKIRND